MNFELRARPVCPICLNDATEFLLVADEYDYHCCGICRGTFVHPAQLPAPAAELARYRQHQNNPLDPGYRHFLNRLVTPLSQRLPPQQRGLDYGCGPDPALAMMLRDKGHDVALFDPFFHPDSMALKRSHDFITCTETAEHFHRPAEEFERLDKLLKPGGLLGIMTKLLADDTQFASWHYRRDFTHVTFYRPETFHWLAARHNWECEIPARDVIIMRKLATS